MKLRMRNNSIRLRLTRGEVAQFSETGHIEEKVTFLSGALHYMLTRSPASRLTADLTGTTLIVHVPEEQADRWASTDQIGMEAHDGSLDILIEKDFQCAHGPRDPDAFAAA